MALLWYSNDDDPASWEAALKRLEPDLDFRIHPDLGDVGDIEAALVWLPPPGLLASLPNLKAILSLAAGVDAMLQDPSLPDLPLCRMIDRSLTDGMTEFVLAHVLRYHRDLHIYAAQQRRCEWNLHLPKPSFERTVGIMGLGELGTATASRLAANGFAVRGWSRSRKVIDNVECFAGTSALGDFLSGCEMLVCLLPLTSETENFLDASLFARLPRGAILIHVGRGRQLVERDLINALDRGHLAAAALDVTPVEPLPAQSPLWRHPAIDLTPHAASYCHPSTAAENVIDNLRRLRRGDELRGVVDRSRGY
ncbi:MAG: glyoxylate/hydroxypyruvate reductase A [Geminicoccaceae bacterium]|nr:glyoxylate/hydroxypyruvate reductase A [Geminicoccaceae bacterium]MCB9943316.1 glyoxylate/hydroxypyruvate reductase A [Geminicoccaceae bacterium]